MIRTALTEQLDQDPDFEWRGKQVTRIENLSDIVFALALGAVVAATHQVLTYSGLLIYLTGLIPIAAGFGVLLAIWNNHFLYFRRYGLADRYVVYLNAGLLLLMLFIAYPLRFVFDSLFAWILGFFVGEWDRMSDLGIDSYRQAGVIIAIFWFGFATINLLFGLMYRHALAKSDVINLTPTEQYKTREAVRTFFAETVFALLIAALAYFSPLGPFAGLFMCLTPLLPRMVRWRMRSPKTEDRSP